MALVLIFKMLANMEVLLPEKISDLLKKVQDWIKSKGLQDMFAVHSYSDFHDDEPYENFACVMVLSTYDPYNFLNGYGDWDWRDEFDELIFSTDFDYEMYSETVAEFFCKDEVLNQLYLSYFEWEWITKLIEPNYTSLYEEVFEYFHKVPRKIRYLEPRRLEVLISEIFKNQGYRTQLGSGWNDGGVDLKIYQKDDIDQIITLVQVKRYDIKNPIRLEAVAGFNAIVEERKANRGLFVTTSRYLPQAKKFAERQKKRLVLADSSDICSWCNKAQTIIVRDKGIVLKDDYILSLLNRPITPNLEGKIVKNNTDFNPDISVNDFCIILKDSQHVCLLMRIPAKAVEDKKAGISREIPILNSTILQFKTRKNVFRAKKSINQFGQIVFCGQHSEYTLWDGEPTYFDPHSSPPNKYVKKLWLLKGQSYDERTEYTCRFY